MREPPQEQQAAIAVSLPRRRVVRGHVRAAPRWVVVSGDSWCVTPGDSWLITPGDPWLVTPGALAGRARRGREGTAARPRPTPMTGAEEGP